MDQHEECIICFESIGDKKYECPQCKNIIHSECYEKVKYEGNELCPFCRRKYSITSIDESPKYCEYKKTIFMFSYCCCILLCTIPYFIIIPFLFYFGHIRMYRNITI